MIHLERLGPEHADAILAGQDAALAAEIVGERWRRESLDDFLGRAAGWRADGPIQEFAAVDAATGRLLGGGGLNRLAPELSRPQVALTYWVLGAERGRGTGVQIAMALIERARRLSGVRQAVLLISEDNHASRAVARRIGAHPCDAFVPHPADGARRVRCWLLDLPGGPVPGRGPEETPSAPQHR